MGFGRSELEFLGAPRPLDDQQLTLGRYIAAARVGHPRVPLIIEGI